jgi:hypothetical protein
MIKTSIDENNSAVNFDSVSINVKKKISNELELNVPNLIRDKENGCYGNSVEYGNSISFIKSYEDTLQKIFKSHDNSNLTNNPRIFLWEINQNMNYDLFKNFSDFNPEEYQIPANLKNVVITGPYIRNCLVNNSLNNLKNIIVRKEIYLYRYGNQTWDQLIDNIDEIYTEKKSEYVLETNDGKKICLVKKKYKSPSHIILQYDYMKRVGWENGSFYASSMFFIEFQKHKDLIMSKFKDPILNIPYDPLDIYYITEKNIKHPLKIIDMVDPENLLTLSEKNIQKLYNSKTLIELCMDKYMKEDHSYILENLEKMILYLCKFEFRRPPFLYAVYIGLELKNNDLFQVLVSVKNKYSECMDNKEMLDKIKNTQINDIKDINNFLLDIIVKLDLPDHFLDFIVFTESVIDKNIINKLIKYNTKNIIEEIISNKILNEYLTYYLILMTNNIELIRSIDFDIDIASNFLKDIITNGVYESFVYLIDNDSSIVTTLFADNKNLLHIIKLNGEYEKIIDKIMDIKPELINSPDKIGEIPIIYHIKHNPKLFECFMKYDVDLTIVDSNGNSCLHYLCEKNEPKLLKKLLKKYPELINMPNLSSEYPIIVCCKNKQEDMFYTLKDFNIDLLARDNYGNTAFHYICANSICLGITIPNIQNYFGLTPKDYCKLSPKYYNFYE